MKHRVTIFIMAIGLAVGTVWYVQASHDIGEQPAFEAGQVLTAEDLNTMVGGIQANADAIDGMVSMADATTFDAGFRDRIPEEDRVVKGAGTLYRTKEGIRVEVSTTDLPPGAYTNWWIIFNNPAGCGDDGCDNLDFGVDSPSESSVMYAAGRMVGEDGAATFRAFLPVGLVRLNRTVDGREQTRLGSGLQEPMGAEIHYIIRYHGPGADNHDDRVEQLSTINGGCDVIGGCYDPQVVVFPIP